MEELTNHIDETGKRNDHDLLMNVAVRQREMCLDMKELKAKIDMMNQRCQIQPRQCSADFVSKAIYDLQYTQLKTSVDEGFKKFKEETKDERIAARLEQSEERRKNRWFMGIMITVINMAATLAIHFMK